MPSVRIVGFKDIQDRISPGEVVINTTSRSEDWGRGLSPFFVGPVALWGPHTAKNVENGWQYSKVYRDHVGEDGDPSPDWYAWAQAGWSQTWASRYPAGKGARPLYSWWNGRRLGYIEARNTIYVPLYARAVARTPAYRELQRVFRSRGSVTLLDFDGYETTATGEDLLPVLQAERRCGHAFVLAGLLLGVIDPSGRRSVQIDV